MFGRWTRTGCHWPARPSVAGLLGPRGLRCFASHQVRDIISCAPHLPALLFGRRVSWQRFKMASRFARGRRGKVISFRWAGRPAAARSAANKDCHRRPRCHWLVISHARAIKLTGHDIKAFPVHHSSLWAAAKPASSGSWRWCHHYRLCLFYLRRLIEG